MWYELVARIYLILDMHKQNITDTRFNVVSDDVLLDNRKYL